MKLNELKPSVPKKSRKRIGRGESSGQGKTAGKGHNGQKSRAGGGVRPGFEGGQNPIIKRVPKRGFKNFAFKKEYAIVNLETLNLFDENSVVSADSLLEKGIIKKTLSGVKILGEGNLEKKLTLKVHKISKSAKEAVESKGGNVEIIEIKTFADFAKNANK